MSHKMVYDEQGVREFSFFNINCGAALEGYIRSQGREPTPQERASINRLYNTELWHFRGVQRTGKVVDPNTLTRSQVERLQARERRDRVEKLAAACTEEKLAELEAADASITDLLPPPRWIKR